MTSVFCTKKYSVHVCLKLWPSFSQLHIFKIAVLLSIPQQLWEQNTQMDKNVYTSLFACFKIFVSNENLEVRLYWGLCGSFVSATKKKKVKCRLIYYNCVSQIFWLLLKSFLRKSEFLDTIVEISSLVNELTSFTTDFQLSGKKLLSFSSYFEKVLLPETGSGINRESLLHSKS